MNTRCWLPSGIICADCWTPHDKCRAIHTLTRFFLFWSCTAESDVRSLLASIEFVLTSASRFSTGEDHLRAELQQVGLPREHAAALAKVHHDNCSSIRGRLIQDSLTSK